MTQVHQCLFFHCRIHMKHLDAAAVVIWGNTNETDLNFKNYKQTSSLEIS